jgi:RND family efflux transporter MFP subunit
MGYVREVKVQIGDRVREGQLLISLDARDLDASVNRAAASREEIQNAIPEADSSIAAAKANSDLAQVTLKRMKELYDKKSISDQEFDEASAKFKGAQAALDMVRAKRKQLDSRLVQADQEVRAAQVSQSYAAIQAPFAGIVTGKSVDPGNLAVPGAPLLTIEREDYRLQVQVDESKLSIIRTGQLVLVSIDGANRAFDARVTEIVPTVDAASRAGTLKIDLPAGPGLRSGAYGRVRFTIAKRAALAIPVAAVSERGQLQSVFVAEGATAHVRLVTLGEQVNGHGEVLSGLNAGENVIYPVPSGLSDGAHIEVRP